ncbi:hypothetical protein KHS38_20800 [Mucilaginibacter sp. Bleaf8]|uniref:hypothetical protein n=1 Tax=Mucilaginibacter sp. Bleaf8 TaxID=2834430 RepID=UPI001BD0A1F3|nr:hypothetical protein [Mucilaginibacter sp. Bleaf8]MBS7566857.1 hypothetical protein [Mucilaginibacter sp. Bleaf8]
MKIVAATFWSGLLIVKLFTCALRPLLPKIKTIRSKERNNSAGVIVLGDFKLNGSAPAIA